KGCSRWAVAAPCRTPTQSWLKQRQQCKADVTCLTKAYNERLKQLDAIYDHIDKPL
ncbi:putative secreted protein, partial [Salmonella enterica subsp. enterica serovar Kentucky str. ATCC 9263]